MTRNVELLQQTMQHITDHPEQHYQGRWICGTAACYAGRAALLSGVTIDEICETPDMWELGANLLGLTTFEARNLFDPDNTRSMLELMVKDLVNGDDLRQSIDYQLEVES